MLWIMNVYNLGCGFAQNRIKFWRQARILNYSEIHYDHGKTGSKSLYRLNEYLWSQRFPSIMEKLVPNHYIGIYLKSNPLSGARISCVELSLCHNKRMWHNYSFRNIIISSYLLEKDRGISIVLHVNRKNNEERNTIIHYIKYNILQLLVAFDYWGKPLKQYFQLSTLFCWLSCHI